MKNILIDLNILLDFLKARAQHQEARRVMELCQSKKINGYICAHEVTTLAYFLDKALRDHDETKKQIHNLLKFLHVLPANTKTLRAALESPIRDFEDAVIEVSALQHRVDAIITRDHRHFSAARVPTMTAREVLRELG